MGHRSTTVFENEISILACPGPATIPVALFQNDVPMPSAPITGGLVKQLASKYPFSLDMTEPPRTSWLCEHVPLSCARSSLIPNTFVEFVWAIVRALPD